MSVNLHAEPLRSTIADLVARMVRRGLIERDQLRRLLYRTLEHAAAEGVLSA